MRPKTQSVPSGLRTPRSRLASAIHSLLLLAAGNALAANEVERVEFNPAFFPAGSGQIDISRFNEGNVVLAGQYRADVTVNGNWIGREELTFANVEGLNNAQLCLERPLLTRLGVDLDGIAQKAIDAGDSVRRPVVISAPTCPAPVSASTPAKGIWTCWFHNSTCHAPHAVTSARNTGIAA